MDLIYIIINKTDINQTILDYSLETNPFTIRKSNDGTQWLLKFNYNKIPLDIYSLGLTLYSQDEITNLISNDSNWITQ